MAKFVATIGLVNRRETVKREFEVDDEDLEGLEGEDRALVIEEVGREIALNALEWDWNEA